MLKNSSRNRPSYNNRRLDDAKASEEMSDTLTGRSELAGAFFPAPANGKVKPKSKTVAVSEHHPKNRR